MRHTEVSREEIASPKPDILEFGKDRVRVFDEKPGYAKTDVPSVLVPGWGTTHENYQSFLSTLRGKGRRTVFVEAPHGIGTEEKGTLPDAEMRKVAALEAGLVGKKDIEKLDLIGHSEGGMVALEYALRNPDKIHSVTLINAAGLLGEDKFLRLAQRYGKDMMRQLLRDPSSGKELFLKENAEATLKHPVRSLKEAVAIAKKADMTHALDVLQERGVPVFLLQTAGDKVFPPEKTYEHLGIEKDLQEDKKPKAVVAWFAAGEDPKGELHNAPMLNTKFAEAADQLLEQTKQNN